jgi:hypothetical protein
MHTRAPPPTDRAFCLRPCPNATCCCVCLCCILLLLSENPAILLLLSDSFSFLFHDQCAIHHHTFQEPHQTLAFITNPSVAGEQSRLVFKEWSGERAYSYEMQICSACSVDLKGISPVFFQISVWGWDQDGGKDSKEFRL